MEMDFGNVDTSYLKDRMPRGFVFLLECLARSFVRVQPSNGAAFAMVFMEEFLIKRNIMLESLPDITYLAKLKEKVDRRACACGEPWQPPEEEVDAEFFISSCLGCGRTTRPLQMPEPDTELIHPEGEGVKVQQQDDLSAAKEVTRTSAVVTYTRESQTRDSIHDEGVQVSFGQDQATQVTASDPGKAPVSQQAPQTIILVSPMPEQALRNLQQQQMIGSPQPEQTYRSPQPQQAYRSPNSRRGSTKKGGGGIDNVVDAVEKEARAELMSEQEQCATCMASGQSSPQPQQAYRSPDSRRGSTKKGGGGIDNVVDAVEKEARAELMSEQEQCATCMASGQSSPQPQQAYRSPQPQQAVRSPQPQQAYRSPDSRRGSTKKGGGGIDNVVDAVEKEARADLMSEQGQCATCMASGQSSPQPQQTYRSPEPQQTYRSPQPQQAVRSPQPQQTYRSPQPQQAVRSPQPQQAYRSPDSRRGSTKKGGGGIDNVVDAVEKEARADLMSEQGQCATCMASGQSSPQPQQTYRSPEPQQTYRSPEPQQAYRSPEPQQAYRSPEPQQAYRSPEPQQAYRSPEPQQAYRSPEPQQAYRSPEPQQAYRSPEPQQTYRSPEPQQAYRSPDSRRGSTKKGGGGIDNVVDAVEKEARADLMSEQGQCATCMASGQSSPQPQQVYRSPQPQQTYRSPQPQQAVRSPQPQQADRSPNSRRGSTKKGGGGIDNVVDAVEKEARAELMSEQGQCATCMASGQSSPQPQQTYRSPEPQQAYRSPQPQQTYRSPQPQQAYRSPEPQQAYRSPQPQQAYRSPQPQQAYRSPEPQQAYRSPQPQQAYRSPEPQQAYRSPQPQQAYRSPDSRRGSTKKGGGGIDNVVDAVEKGARAELMSEQAQCATCMASGQSSPQPQQVYRSPQPQQTYRSPQPQQAYRSPDSRRGSTKKGGGGIDNVVDAVEKEARAELMSEQGQQCATCMASVQSSPQPSPQSAVSPSNNTARANVGGSSPSSPARGQACSGCEKRKGGSSPSSPARGQACSGCEKRKGGSSPSSPVFRPPPQPFEILSPMSVQSSRPVADPTVDRNASPHQAKSPGRLPSTEPYAILSPMHISRGFIPVSGPVPVSPVKPKTQPQSPRTKQTGERFCGNSFAKEVEDTALSELQTENPQLAVKPISDPVRTKQTGERFCGNCFAKEVEDTALSELQTENPQLAVKPISDPVRSAVSPRMVCIQEAQRASPTKGPACGKCVATAVEARAFHELGKENPLSIQITGCQVQMDRQGKSPTPPVKSSSSPVRLPSAEPCPILSPMPYQVARPFPGTLSDSAATIKPSSPLARRPSPEPFTILSPMPNQTTTSSLPLSPASGSAARRPSTEQYLILSPMPGSTSGSARSASPQTCSVCGGRSSRSSQSRPPRQAAQSRADKGSRQSSFGDSGSTPASSSVRSSPPPTEPKPMYSSKGGPQSHKPQQPYSQSGPYQENEWCQGGYLPAHHGGPCVPLPPCCLAAGQAAAMMSPQTCCHADAAAAHTSCPYCQAQGYYYPSTTTAAPLTPPVRSSPPAPPQQFQPYLEPQHMATQTISSERTAGSVQRNQQAEDRAIEDLTQYCIIGALSCLEPESTSCMAHRPSPQPQQDSYCTCDYVDVSDLPDNASLAGSPGPQPRDGGSPEPAINVNVNVEVDTNFDSTLFMQQVKDQISEAMERVMVCQKQAMEFQRQCLQSDQQMLQELRGVSTSDATPLMITAGTPGTSPKNTSPSPRILAPESGSSSLPWSSTRQGCVQGVRTAAPSPVKAETPEPSTMLDGDYPRVFSDPLFKERCKNGALAQNRRQDSGGTQRSFPPSCGAEEEWLDTALASGSFPRPPRRGLTYSLKTEPSCRNRTEGGKRRPESSTQHLRNRERSDWSVEQVLKCRIQNKPRHSAKRVISYIDKGIFPDRLPSAKHVWIFDWILGYFLRRQCRTLMGEFRAKSRCKPESSPRFCPGCFVKEQLSCLDVSFHIHGDMNHDGEKNQSQDTHTTLAVTPVMGDEKSLFPNQRCSLPSEFSGVSGHYKVKPMRGDLCLTSRLPSAATAVPSASSGIADFTGNPPHYALQCADWSRCRPEFPVARHHLHSASCQTKPQRVSHSQLADQVPENRVRAKGCCASSSGQPVVTGLTLFQGHPKPSQKVDRRRVFCADFQNQSIELLPSLQSSVDIRTELSVGVAGGNYLLESPKRSNHVNCSRAFEAELGVAQSVQASKEAADLCAGDAVAKQTSGRQDIPVGTDDSVQNRNGHFHVRCASLIQTAGVRQAELDPQHSLWDEASGWTEDSSGQMESRDDEAGHKGNGHDPRSLQHAYRMRTEATISKLVTSLKQSKLFLQQMHSMSTTDLCGYTHTATHTSTRAQLETSNDSTQALVICQQNAEICSSKSKSSSTDIHKEHGFSIDHVNLSEDSDLYNVPLEDCEICSVLPQNDTTLMPLLAVPVEECPICSVTAQSEDLQNSVEKHVNILANDTAVHIADQSMEAVDCDTASARSRTREKEVKAFPVTFRKSQSTVTFIRGILQEVLQQVIDVTDDVFAAMAQDTDDYALTDCPSLVWIGRRLAPPFSTRFPKTRSQDKNMPARGTACIACSRGRSENTPEVKGHTESSVRAVPTVKDMLSGLGRDHTSVVSEVGSHDEHGDRELNWTCDDRSGNMRDTTCDPRTVLYPPRGHFHHGTSGVKEKSHALNVVDKPFTGHSVHEPHQVRPEDWYVSTPKMSDLNQSLVFYTALFKHHPDVQLSVAHCICIVMLKALNTESKRRLRRRGAASWGAGEDRMPWRWEVEHLRNKTDICLYDEDINYGGRPEHTFFPFSESAVYMFGDENELNTNTSARTNSPELVENKPTTTLAPAAAGLNTDLCDVDAQCGSNPTTSQGGGSTRVHLGGHCSAFTCWSEAQGTGSPLGRVTTKPCETSVDKQIAVQSSSSQHGSGPQPSHANGGPENGQHGPRSLAASPPQLRCRDRVCAGHTRGSRSVSPFRKGVFSGTNQQSALTVGNLPCCSLTPDNLQLYTDWLEDKERSPSSATITQSQYSPIASSEYWSAESDTDVAASLSDENCPEEEQARREKELSELDDFEALERSLQDEELRQDEKNGAQTPEHDAEDIQKQQDLEDFIAVEKSIYEELQQEKAKECQALKHGREVQRQQELSELKEFVDLERAIQEEELEQKQACKFQNLKHDTGDSVSSQLLLPFSSAAEEDEERVPFSRLLYSDTDVLVAGLEELNKKSFFESPTIVKCKRDKDFVAKIHGATSTPEVKAAGNTNAERTSTRVPQYRSTPDMRKIARNLIPGVKRGDKFLLSTSKADAAVQKGPVVSSVPHTTAADTITEGQIAAANIATAVTFPSISAEQPGMALPETLGGSGKMDVHCVPSSSSSAQNENTEFLLDSVKTGVPGEHLADGGFASGYRRCDLTDCYRSSRSASARDSLGRNSSTRSESQCRSSSGSYLGKHARVKNTTQSRDRPAVSCGTPQENKAKNTTPNTDRPHVPFRTPHVPFRTPREKKAEDGAPTTDRPAVPCRTPREKESKTGTPNRERPPVPFRTPRETEAKNGTPNRERPTVPRRTPREKEIETGLAREQVSSAHCDQQEGGAVGMDAESKGVPCSLPQQLPQSTERSSASSSFTTTVPAADSKVPEIFPVCSQRPSPLPPAQWIAHAAYHETGGSSTGTSEQYTPVSKSSGSVSATKPQACRRWKRCFITDESVSVGYIVKEKKSLPEQVSTMDPMPVKHTPKMNLEVKYTPRRVLEDAPKIQANDSDLSPQHDHQVKKSPIPRRNRNINIDTASSDSTTNRSAIVASFPSREAIELEYEKSRTYLQRAKRFQSEVKDTETGESECWSEGTKASAQKYDPDLPKTCNINVPKPRMSRKSVVRKPDLAATEIAWRSGNSSPRSVDTRSEYQVGRRKLVAGECDADGAGGIQSRYGLSKSVDNVTTARGAVRHQPFQKMKAGKYAEMSDHACLLTTEESRSSSALNVEDSTEMAAIEEETWPDRTLDESSSSSDPSVDDEQFWAKCKVISLVGAFPNSIKNENEEFNRLDNVSTDWTEHEDEDHDRQRQLHDQKEMCDEALNDEQKDSVCKKDGDSFSPQSSCSLIKMDPTTVGTFFNALLTVVNDEFTSDDSKPCSSKMLSGQESLIHDTKIRPTSADCRSIGNAGLRTVEKHRSDMSSVSILQESTTFCRYLLGNEASGQPIKKVNPSAGSTCALTREGHQTTDLSGVEKPGNPCQLKTDLYDAESAESLLFDDENPENPLSDDANPEDPMSEEDLQHKGVRSFLGKRRCQNDGTCEFLATYRAYKSLGKINDRVKQMEN